MGGCTTCPFNYHMYQNECYLNITGCTQYTNNASGYLLCTACDASISLFDGQGGCRLTVSQQRKRGFIQNSPIVPTCSKWQPITEIYASKAFLSLLRLMILPSVSSTATCLMESINTSLVLLLNLFNQSAFSLLEIRSNLRYFTVVAVEDLCYV